MSLEYAQPFAEDAAPAGSLRVDVYPPSGPEGLLPQSFYVPPEGVGSSVGLGLAASATAAGTLSGEILSSWANGTPTQVSPVAGTLTLSRTPLVQGAVAVTEEGGESATFSLGAPLGSYQLAIVPADATASPVTVFDEFELDSDLDASAELESGVPVYGRVTDARGEGVAGAEMVLTDMIAEVSSSTFTTDATGWYVARALPGTWRVAVVGSTTSRVLPAVSTELEVGDEGAEAYLDLGSVPESGDSPRLSGQVLDADGEPVEGATISAVSSSLAEASGSLEASTTTSDKGFFTLPLLDGRYRLEVYAPYDQPASPLIASVTVDGDLDVGDLTLGETVRMAGRVIDASGNAVSGARVTGRQVGLGEFVYSTSSSRDGTWMLEFPESDVELFVEPGGSLGAVTIEAAATDDVLVTVEEGVGLAGTVTFEGEDGSTTGIGFSVVEVRDYNSGQLLARTATGEDGAFSVSVTVPVGSADTAGGASDTAGAETGDTATD
jgi:protocatechuate 3,4-dioxygenase beta subunit